MDGLIGWYNVEVCHGGNVVTGVGKDSQVRYVTPIKKEKKGSKDVLDFYEQFKNLVEAGSVKHNIQ
ncbi:hypothetical protein E2562_028308 [Oryza meyeriana var. granulata]|uniref:Uncharacterized protein n=1 Tax=Oryza meyeriana var. granulata TaxID=110450 RepID=A0A6G1FCX6_9ORYZ|nr:hypothetical protein E2562_028308 [Oryza meyeriana var. granulata]